MEELTDAGHWITVLITLVVVAACVGLHYEVLSNCSRILKVLSHRRRRRVLVLILVILLTHVVEIWLFALAYYLIVQVMGIGVIAGAAPGDLLEYAYYSAVVYTTVGFGDMLPEGAIRFMSGTEALSGLVLITWSASLTFLEMQRDWETNR